jgi:hypothetical protein
MRRWLVVLVLFASSAPALGQERVERLVAELAGTDAAQTEALSALGDLSPDEVQALCARLTGDTPLETRLLVARRLGRIRAQAGRRWLEALGAEASSSGTWVERRQVTCVTTVALLRLGGPTRDADSAQSLVRIALEAPATAAGDALAGEALEGLGLVRRSDVIATLEPEVRGGRERSVRAIQLAGVLRLQELAPVLEEILSAPEPPEIKQAVIQSLGRLGDAGLGRLLNRLSQRPGDAPPAVLAQLREALDAVAANPTPGPLRGDLLRAVHGYLDDEEALLRRAALRAVAGYGDPSSQEPLRRLVRGRPAASTAELILRRRALAAAGVVDEDTARRLVEAGRGEDDPDLALGLVDYLRGVDAEGVVAPALIELLEHQARVVRGAALLTLEERFGRTQGARLDPDASPRERRARDAVRAWRAWWADRNH